MIHLDVAQAEFRLKIDLSNAYKQVQVEPADVWKTSSTVQGVYESLVMQQGNCNTLSTFQRLMIRTFVDYIDKFMHAYMDNIFVLSNTINEHQNHLKLTFEKLHENSLYLYLEKCQLFMESMECLGHIIDKEGLHADGDKMAQIREWKKPCNYLEVQCFLVVSLGYSYRFTPNNNMFNVYC